MSDKEEAEEHSTTEKELKKKKQKKLKLSTKEKKKKEKKRKKRKRESIESNQQGREDIQEEEELQASSTALNNNSSNTNEDAKSLSAQLFGNIFSESVIGNKSSAQVLRTSKIVSKPTAQGGKNNEATYKIENKYEEKQKEEENEEDQEFVPTAAPKPHQKAIDRKKARRKEKAKKKTKLAEQIDPEEETTVFVTNVPVMTDRIRLLQFLKQKFGSESVSALWFQNIPFVSGFTQTTKTDTATRDAKVREFSCLSFFFFFILFVPLLEPFSFSHYLFFLFWLHLLLFFFFICFVNSEENCITRSENPNAPLFHFLKKNLWNKR